ncbi:MAG: ABC transporter permease [Herpetosiphonaceae bacterium]|nr:ABC transporter permease [Herpetosiphonaceae bacterium]
MDLIWQGLVDAIKLLVHGDPQTLRVAGLSLLVSGMATLLASLLGVPLGALLALRRFRGREVLVSLVNTGMGLPPVVVGLFVALLLWRSGPLGKLGLMYTPGAMILAQLLVAAPLAAGLTASALGLLDVEVVAALRVDGAGEGRVLWEMLRAARPQVRVAIAAAFGRAISEVGASLMVGGNILNETRILTTAVTLEVGKGEFARAIALGLVLLVLAFIVNLGLAQGGRRALQMGLA